MVIIAISLKPAAFVLDIRLLVSCNFFNFILCRLSGLIVDIFGDIAVVASSAAWVEKYRPEIEFYINQITGLNHIKWRQSVDILKEEGMDVSELSEWKIFCSSGKVKVFSQNYFFI